MHVSWEKYCAVHKDGPGCRRRHSLAGRFAREAEDRLPEGERRRIVLAGRLGEIRGERHSRRSECTARLLHCSAAK